MEYSWMGSSTRQKLDPPTWEVDPTPTWKGTDVVSDHEHHHEWQPGDWKQNDSSIYRIIYPGSHDFKIHPKFKDSPHSNFRLRMFLSQNLHKKSFHSGAHSTSAHFLRFRKEMFHLFKQLWDLVASHAQ